MAEDRNLAAQYDEAYYIGGGLGQSYHRGNPIWSAFFGQVADAIVTRIAPRSAVDAGCGIGFLVEELRRRGVDARGVDISEYAIGEVPPALHPYCSLGSVMDDLGGPYDLAVCIEVVEHLPEEQGRIAIANLAAAAPRVLFSSTSDDVAEPTHVNVRPREYWLALFAEHGLEESNDLDAAVVAPHALYLARRGAAPRRLAALSHRVRRRFR